ncbi:MAG: hypothetical protein KDH88_08335 [Chromatiales bacterium]|nr:hypothetical protein [Chromatiales bacterium]
MKRLFSLTILVLLAATARAAVDARQVADTYVNIGAAVYQDSVIAAQNLGRAVDALLAEPNQANLMAARAAWRAARVPYQQSEAFRFGNPEVDDWEGKVNAWPLDEGLIDYVAESYGDENDENPFYAANVIANPRLRIGGREVDATRIAPALLAETLNEIDGVESNVARGYHAIEFLLWGQDLNGTGPGAGNRPASDFNSKHCTGGNCERRGAYLRAATDLLISDLSAMADEWAQGGAIRKRILAGDPTDTLRAILTGIGSLSYGELAGERIKLGLMLHDPEEEHDCFSDNTHWSHYYDVVGMRNLYEGHYRRIDGSLVSGPSLSDLVKARDAASDETLRERLAASLARAQHIVDRAEAGESYDQLLAGGNRVGNALILALVEALVEQTRALERVVSALDLGSLQFEGSDSLDAPQKVGS